MFAQAALLFFALTAQLVAAAPPACLIAAVSNQTNPADIKSICSSDNATSIEQYLCQNCGSNAQLALSSFASVCSSAGVTISTSSACSNNNSSSSSSASGMASSTVSGHLVTVISTSASGRVTATMTVGPNGNATLTSGATPTPMSSGAKASGSAATAIGSAKASSSSTPAASNTGAVARLSMDCLGLLAVGMLGAMLVL